LLAGARNERISGAYRACGLLAPNLNISASRAISSADFELGVHGALLAQATPDTRFGLPFGGFMYLSWVPNAMYYRF
jgi:hypothetical protein